MVRSISIDGASTQSPDICGVEGHVIVPLPIHVVSQALGSVALWLFLYKDHELPSVCHGYSYRLGSEEADGDMA